MPALIDHRQPLESERPPLQMDLPRRTPSVDRSVVADANAGLYGPASPVRAGEQPAYDEATVEMAFIQAGFPDTEAYTGRHRNELSDTFARPNQESRAHPTVTRLVGATSLQAGKLTDYRGRRQQAAQADAAAWPQPSAAATQEWGNLMENGIKNGQMSAAAVARHHEASANRAASIDAPRRSSLGRRLLSTVFPRLRRGNPQV
jgi:hypothetical protein